MALFCLDLDEPHSPDGALIDGVFGLLHQGQKSGIFRYHELYGSLPRGVDHPLGLFQVTGNRLFHQNVLPVVGRVQGVFTMEIVGSKEIQGLNPRVPGCILVSAKEVPAVEHAAVLLCPVLIPAGEEKLYMFIQRAYRPGHGNGILPASHYTESQSHFLNYPPCIFRKGGADRCPLGHERPSCSEGRRTPHRLEPEQYPWLNVKLFVGLWTRFPYPACATQGVPRRANALSCNSSLRITATKAKLPGFPR